MTEDGEVPIVADTDDGVYVVLVLGNDDVRHELWYVWRRSDSLVGITNVPPIEAFPDDYAYHELLVTASYERAHHEALMARSAN